MKEIPIWNGPNAIVDTEDYAWLSKYKWFINDKGAGTFEVCAIVPMKRLVVLEKHVESPNGFIIHKNHDPLDNRRANLKICNKSEQRAHARKNKGCNSRFKGVDYHTRSQKWRARIGKNYNRMHIGYFDSEEEAAKAYNKAASEFFGEVAFLNEV